MTHGFLDIATTPSVRAVQAAMGSDRVWQNLKGDRAFDKFTPYEAAFNAQRDSFYMASVSETGWPYIQHRGGQKGFLHVLDEQTIGFADLRGNKQYISLGNLEHDDRVALFLMDYPSQSRLKILGHAEFHEDDDPARELLETLRMPEEQTPAERAVLIHVEAFDWNCQQHITPRYTEEEIAEIFEPMRRRIEALEKENARLRAAQPPSS